MKDVDITEQLKTLIKDELKHYSDNLFLELRDKFLEEFEEKMRTRSNELVLEVAEKIKMESSFNETDMAINVVIKI